MVGLETCSADPEEQAEIWRGQMKQPNSGRSERQTARSTKFIVTRIVPGLGSQEDWECVVFEPWNTPAGSSVRSIKCVCLHGKFKVGGLHSIRIVPYDVG